MTLTVTDVFGQGPATTTLTTDSTGEYLFDNLVPGDYRVRFHLPSRVYGHHNAADGVERGNILAWRQGVGAALDGGRLAIAAIYGCWLQTRQ